MMANILLPQESANRVTPLDANNNCAQKCYSLRPRSTPKPPEEDDLPEKSIAKPRSRTRGRQQQNHPPLSKYRRKTANARERSRMREINEAFETLRKAIPQVASSRDTQNEKLTKISTLRLAMDYISALHKVLQDSEESGVFNSFVEEFGTSSLIPQRTHEIPPPSYPNIPIASSTFQHNSITSEFQDLSLTPSELTDHSLSSTSEESDLFLISIDLESLEKDPILPSLNSSIQERTFSSLDQNYGPSNFQEQCSVFDEVLFLTSST